MASKAELLHELIHGSYVKVGPSPIDGVGVFALRPIPKDCCDMFSAPNPNDQWHMLTWQEVESLPKHARVLVENYCLFDEQHYYVPHQGFKAIDVSLFLNHSDTPNIESINEGNYFRALRDIAEGEELLIDYGTIVEGDKP